MKFGKIHYKICVFIILNIFLTFLIGCGGGGGSGSSTLTNPSSPYLPDVLSFLSDLPLPSGYQSLAFPANFNQYSITLNNFTSNNYAYVIFINTFNSVNSAFITATLNTPNIANVKSLLKFATNEVSHSHFYQNTQISNPIHLHSIYKPNFIPSANFQRKLRELERNLPPINKSTNKNNFNIDANYPFPQIHADPVNIGTQMEFKIPGSNNLPIVIQAVCRSKVQLPTQSGGYLLIFVDINDTYTNETNQFVQKISENFIGDSIKPGIYLKVREIFGEEPPAYFNNLHLGNDIYILITSKVSTIDSGLAGFFWSGDLYPPENVNPPISNQKKIFYLTNITQNSVPTLTEYTMYATLAHEFQHMINFYQRKINNLIEHTWLNEAMSGYAEHICGYSITTNNQSKALQINEYFKNTNNVSLTNWQDTHENYGLVYLFGVWFAQKYSPNNSGVIANLLKLNKVGSDAVSHFASEPFEKITAKFMLALTINDPSHKFYGLNDIDLRATYNYPAPLSPVTLTGPQTPASIPSFNGSYPYNSNAFYLQQHSFATFKLQGTNSGSSISISFSNTIPVFEIHK